MKLTPIEKMGCASGFEGKGAMQEQSGRVVGALSRFVSKETKGLWAIRSQGIRIKAIHMGTSQIRGKIGQKLLAKEMYQRAKRFKMRGDGSRGKRFERRDNLIARQVEK
ncbi:hypothetical protein J1N35_022283 [Gossypium stocksii]|uniref:Uncharacterized protein n=1 Tax=Gossypium stocksii TaxID=47602 RepID=A0A9D4A2M1_9ROSI|nr:hypothetical protein J1N35_022283 [Gossypium stocksii]